MKNILLIIFYLLIGFQSIAQEKSVSLESDKIYSAVQEKASPIEGVATFFQRFIKEFNYDVITSNESEIKVRMIFVIEKDGSFSNITAENSNENYREEAIRVLKTMPNWKPAKESNEAVRSRFVLPITLKNKNVKK